VTLRAKPLLGEDLRATLILAFNTSYQKGLEKNGVTEVGRYYIDCDLATALERAEASYTRKCLEGAPPGKTLTQAKAYMQQCGWRCVLDHLERQRSAERAAEMTAKREQDTKDLLARLEQATSEHEAFLVELAAVIAARADHARPCWKTLLMRERGASYDEIVAEYGGNPVLHYKRRQIAAELLERDSPEIAAKLRKGMRTTC
jgi:hypothetical protein